MIQFARLLPIEIVLVAALIALGSWISRLDFRKWKTAFLGVLVFVNVAGLGYVALRLAAAVAGNPMVPEVLRLLRDKPECSVLFGGGIVTYDETNFRRERWSQPDLADALAKTKPCYSLLTEISLSEPTLRERLLQGARSFGRLLSGKPLPVTDAHPEITRNGIRAYRIYDMIRFDLPQGPESITPVLCYPSPRIEAPKVGFYFADTRSFGLGDSVTLRDGVGGRSLLRVKMLLDSQWLCGGLKFKINGVESTFLFHSGRILALDSHGAPL